MVRIGVRMALGALLAAAAFPAAAQSIGENAAVVNDVRMSTQAEPAVHRARVRERISIGNPVQTGRASHLQILLLDGTSFQVGENARLTIDRFVYDPSRSASEVGGNVARGSFRFVSGAPTRRRPGQSGIRTPVASIGVRGTIVEGVVGEDAVRIFNDEAVAAPVAASDPATASLIVLRGPGAGVPGEPAGAIDVTAGERTVAVESVGYAVYVPGPDQPPIGPFLLSDRGTARLMALLGDPAHFGRDSEIDLLPRADMINGVLDLIELY